MRPFFGVPIVSTLCLLLLVPIAIASPFAFDENPLEKRCANPCGWNHQLCCSADQACSTNAANQAVCIDGAGSGSWEYFTTTIVVTAVDMSTITSVWSSHIQTAAPTATGTCRVDLGESVCGSTCCGAAQECQEGVCVAESSSVAVTGAEATPGVRGTSSGASTVTQTSAPTTTEAFIPPVGTDGAVLIGVHASGTGGGLSGGAIAGIVIGTIAGVILLLLLCGCLCFKGALEGLLAALGIRKRRRRETTVIEERYSHHSHGSRPPPARRTWFGTKPAVAGTESEVSEKKSKFSWAKIAIILGALALCLGLRRRKDQDHDDESKTSYSYPSSYYYYSDYTRSSESSGGRTRDTRRSRRSRRSSRR